MFSALVGVALACVTLASGVYFVIKRKAQVSIQSLAWIGWHQTPGAWQGLRSWDSSVHHSDADHDPEVPEGLSEKAKAQPHLEVWQSRGLSSAGCLVRRHSNSEGIAVVPDLPHGCEVAPGGSGATSRRFARLSRRPRSSLASGSTNPRRCIRAILVVASRRPSPPHCVAPSASADRLTDHAHRVKPADRPDQGRPRRVQRGAGRRRSAGRADRRQAGQRPGGAGPDPARARRGEGRVTSRWPPS